MTTYRTPFSGVWRLRIEVGLTGQRGISSMVSTSVFIESSGGAGSAGFIDYIIHVGNVSLRGTKSVASTSPVAIVVQELQDWSHDMYGVAWEFPVYADLEFRSSTGGRYGGKFLRSLFQLPNINRLPSAPPQLTLETTLDKVLCAVATAATNGGADITEYEVQVKSGSGGWALVPVALLTARWSDLAKFGAFTVWRARAKSEAGWGPYSIEVPYSVPMMLGVRAVSAAVDAPCQTAERYVGGGVWVPVTVLEKAGAAGWSPPIATV